MLCTNYESLSPLYMAKQVDRNRLLFARDDLFCRELCGSWRMIDGSPTFRYHPMELHHRLAVVGNTFCDLTSFHRISVVKSVQPEWILSLVFLTVWIRLKNAEVPIYTTAVSDCLIYHLQPIAYLGYHIISYLDSTLFLCYHQSHRLSAQSPQSLYQLPSNSRICMIAKISKPPYVWE